MNLESLSSVQDQIVKFATNAVIVIQYHIFCHSPHEFLQELNHGLDLVASFSGWGNTGLIFAKNMLRGLTSKIVFSSAKWMHDFKAKEWER
jgi:hypothetical protein